MDVSGVLWVVGDGWELDFWTPAFEAGGHRRDDQAVALPVGDRNAVLSPAEHDGVPVTLLGATDGAGVVVQSVGAPGSPGCFSLSDWISDHGWPPRPHPVAVDVEPLLERLFDSRALAWVHRPVVGDGQVTFAVAHDSREVVRVLGPVLGDSLLVNPSEFSAADIERVSRYIAETSVDLLAFGRRLTPAGQVGFYATPPTPSEELEEFAASCPEGLLDGCAWIRPRAASDVDDPEA